MSLFQVLYSKCYKKVFKYSPTGESHTSHLLSVSPVSVLAYFKFHLLCVFLTYHPCATNSHHNSFFTLCFSSSCKGKTYWLLWVSEHCEFNLKKHFQINLLHDLLSVTNFAVIIQTPSSHLLYVHSVNMAMPRGCEAAAGMGFKPLKWCLMGAPIVDPGQSLSSAHSNLQITYCHMGHTVNYKGIEGNVLCY